MRRGKRAIYHKKLPVCFAAQFSQKRSVGNREPSGHCQTFWVTGDLLNNLGRPLSAAEGHQLPIPDLAGGDQLAITLDFFSPAAADRANSGYRHRLVKGIATRNHQDA